MERGMIVSNGRQTSDNLARRFKTDLHLREHSRAHTQTHLGPVGKYFIIYRLGSMALKAID